MLLVGDPVELARDFVAGFVTLADVERVVELVVLSAHPLLTTDFAYK